jgi:hypothetical protein
MMRKVVSLSCALVAGSLVAGCGDTGSRAKTTATDAAVGPSPTRCLPSPLHVSRARVRAGTTLTVSSDASACAARYPSRKTYTLSLGQVGRAAPLRLAVVAVRRNGAFKAKVRVPSTASPGEAYIVVRGSPFDDCKDTPPQSCAGYGARLTVLAPD